MKRRCRRLAGAGLLAGLLVIPRFAGATESQGGPLNVELALGAGLMSGYTAYEVGGDFSYVGPAASLGSGTEQFPISRLEFPLDVFTAEARLGLDLGSYLHLKGSVTTNVSEDAGSMTDEDFGPVGAIGQNAAPDQVTIFSRSGTDLDMVGFDVCLQGHVLQRETFTLNLGIGYLYQNFEFTTSPFSTTFPAEMPGSPLYGAELYSPVPGIEYEATHTAPYVNLGMAWRISPQLHIAADFDYSPVAGSEDEDHHLLRGFYSEGDSEGDFFRFTLTAAYEVNEAWFVRLLLSGLRFDTDGDDNTFVEPGATELEGRPVSPALWGVQFFTQEKTMESSQFHALLSLGYRF